MSRPPESANETREIPQRSERQAASQASPAGGKAGKREKTVLPPAAAWPFPAAEAPRARQPARRSASSQCHPKQRRARLKRSRQLRQRVQPKHPRQSPSTSTKTQPTQFTLRPRFRDRLLSKRLPVVMRPTLQKQMNQGIVILNPEGPASTLIRALPASRAWPGVMPWTAEG